MTSAADGPAVDRFETWGLLELMGRTRLAGKLSEQTIAGIGFIRIDVPPVGATQGFTRFFTASALYGMTPLGEATARALAATLRSVPIDAYEVRSLAAPALQSRVDFDEDDPR